jgi:hypothetical protein
MCCKTFTVVIICQASKLVCMSNPVTFIQVLYLSHSISVEVVALATNITLVTNTLAYNSAELITAVKSYVKDLCICAVKLLQL